MPLLEDQRPEPLSQRLLVPGLQLAGIFFTGYLMWRSSLGLQWERVGFGWLLLRASVYAIAACWAAAVITIVIYLAASMWEREDLMRVTFRASSVAVWFAPCVILLTQLSPVAALPALLLVINATHLLYIQWRVQQPPVEPPPRDAELFEYAQLPQRRFIRDFGPGLAISVTLQSGVCALLLHYTILSGFAFAGGVALATLFALTSRGVQPAKPPKSMPRAFLGLALTILLAIGVTIGGMLPNLMRGPGGGDSAFGTKPSPGMPGDGRPDLPDASAGNIADASGFPGVILWPEVKPIPTLIAPMPQTPDGGGPPVMPRPLSIPFSGEYWMYRWPYARPPKTSFFQRGSPAALSFSSTDRRPLQMEAHHKLDQHVALSCCSAIRLEIRNADRYPDTISLELTLIDNELPGSPSLNLGHYRVVSHPDISKDPVVPVSESLEFPVPAGASLDSFNEFKVVFQRAYRRADKSAKLAIDRFVLIPRIY